MTWLVLAGLPALPLLVTVANVVGWRAPRPGPVARRVSALVPARDEEATIGACVRALLAEPVHEVIVCDDGSTDGTRRALDAFADPRLRVISGRPLPPGWVGKPHACHQLAEAATGDVLLFVDADVTVAAGAVGRLLGVDADVVSAFPHQRAVTVGERLVVPLLHLTYASFLWLPLVALVPDERVCAANGQLLAVSRDAYAALGGFEAVRAEVVDDVAFCRLAKRLGRRVAFVDGTLLAECRMYGSLGDAVAGFSKNLYEGIGGTLPALVGVLALYVGCFLLPWLAWPWAPLPAAVGIACNLAQRALLAGRFGLPWTTVAAHPVGIALFLGIALNSARWVRAGRIAWRGRTYAARGAR